MTEYNENLHNNSKGFAFEYARSLRKIQTKAEQILWEALRNDQLCKLKFRRQHPFDNYILDFYNHKMKLVIEVDGEIHNDPEVEAYDKIRTLNLNENGLTVLRFKNNEVENNLKAVLKKIEGWFEENDLVELEPWPEETEDPTITMNKSSNNSEESKAPLSSRRGAGGEVNRLTQLFKEKHSNILNMYCTAGYPQLSSTVEVMVALQNNGADIIELGIPYSDPIADGPVIQQSNMQALQNGMSIPVLFEQLKIIRQRVQLPIILMGYMNPVLQYGIEKFCADAASAGIDGIILPDLPMHEFETAYRRHFIKYDLKFIFLVTPQTSEERIRQIDALSSGFIYAVSSSSTTGNSQNLVGTKPVEDQAGYFKKLKAMNLTNPVLVGFGIKDKETFEAACKYSNGGIIGSAYINALKDTNDIDHCTKDFINTLKG
ncbi:MAG: tryptophan synthase subunit alpha [Ferruginibacter sp.]